MTMVDAERHELEQYVLGALLLQPEAILPVARLEPPITWRDAGHQTLFEALWTLALQQRKRPLTRVRLLRVLAKDPHVTRRGQAYLWELVQRVPQPLPMSAFDAADMLREQQQPQQARPSNACLSTLIRQAMRTWQTGQATTLRQGLFLTMHHHDCIDEWKYVCAKLAEWGLYGLSHLIVHVMQEHLPTEGRSPEAWKEAMDCLSAATRHQGDKQSWALEGLVLTVGALAFLGALDQTRHGEAPEGQAPQG